MKLEPIRLRLVPRQPLSDELNPREAFWSAIRRSNELESDISESEGKLRRDFGSSLRQLLIQELGEPLRQIERTLYQGEFRDLEHFLFRVFEKPRSENS